MELTALVNGKVILEERIVEQNLIFTEQIQALVDDLHAYPQIKKIDAEGCYIAPGLIDLHIHGLSGYAVSDGKEGLIQEMAKVLPTFGVTAFLPTTMTMEATSIMQALGAIRSAKEADGSGAKVLGAHLEGPFINPDYKGAHDPAQIIPPDYELFAEFYDIINLITYAPEMDKGFIFTDKIINNTAVTLSIGHSDASYETALEAINRGAKSTTHLFNAMSGIKARELGVAGAALNSEVYSKLIADTIHLAPAMFQLVTKLKSPERIILVSDSIPATNVGDGIYSLGGQKIIVDQGIARLQEGNLAGSTLRLIDGVKNFVNHAGVDLSQGIKAATLNPARLLNLDQRIGSIEIGKAADLIVFDKDFQVKRTFINGREY